MPIQGVWRKYNHARLHQFTVVQDQGRAASDAIRTELDSRIAALDYDSICVMLYTSGTTGKPKGVVLSNPQHHCVGTQTPVTLTTSPRTMHCSRICRSPGLVTLFLRWVNLCGAGCA